MSGSFLSAGPRTSDFGRSTTRLRRSSLASRRLSRWLIDLLLASSGAKASRETDTLLFCSVLAARCGSFSLLPKRPLQIRSSHHLNYTLRCSTPAHQNHSYRFYYQSHHFEPFRTIEESFFPLPAHHSNLNLKSHFNNL